MKKIATSTLLAVVLIACLKKKEEKNYDNHTLDANFSKEIVQLEHKGDIFYTQDSLVSVQFICEDNSDSEIIRNEFILHADDSDFSGEKIERKLIIETDSKTGRVVSVFVKEGLYRDRFNAYGEVMRFNIVTDSCRIKSASISL